MENKYVLHLNVKNNNSYYIKNHNNLKILFENNNDY